MSTVIYYILSALAVLIILTIHEYAHGYVAYKLGDNTAKSMGRLSLNPIKHLDPAGAVCMLLFHFGWAKPVPINPRNFKNPKKGFAAVALAGPISNLLTAFFSGFFYLLLASVFSDMRSDTTFLRYFVENLLLFLNIFFYTNIGLAIFNLIPIPPLDGSRILAVLLPPKAYFGLMKYERQIYIGLIVWLIGGTYLSSLLLSIPLIAGNAVLAFFAKYISLTNIIGSLVNIIARGMLEFWSLIPFLNF